MKNGLVYFLICVLLASGCATSSSPAATKPANVKEWMAVQSRAKKKAIAGFVIGALLGVANGHLTGADAGDIWMHALGGGIAGGAAGLALGQHQDRIYAHRDLAVRQAGYDRSKGYIARVEEVSFDRRSRRRDRP
jgi:uncharacterized protein YcfJ